MSRLHHPPARFICGISALFGPLLLAALDVRNEASYYHDFQGRFSAAACVKAEALRSLTYIGPLDNNGIKQGFYRPFPVPEALWSYSRRRLTLSIPG
jgi:hypothetical protein